MVAGAQFVLALLIAFGSMLSAAISSGASAGRSAPGLSTRVPPDETSPAMISACAFARDSQSWRPTRS